MRILILVALFLLCFPSWAQHEGFTPYNVKALEIVSDFSCTQEHFSRVQAFYLNILSDLNQLQLRKQQTRGKFSLQFTKKLISIPYRVFVEAIQPLNSSLVDACHGSPLFQACVNDIKNFLHQETPSYIEALGFHDIKQEGQHFTIELNEEQFFRITNCLISS